MHPFPSPSPSRTHTTHSWSTRKTGKTPHARGATEIDIAEVRTCVSSTRYPITGCHGRLVRPCCYRFSRIPHWQQAAGGTLCTHVSKEANAKTPDYLSRIARTSRLPPCPAIGLMKVPSTVQPMTPIASTTRSTVCSKCFIGKTPSSRSVFAAS